jgi:hypothetical protein
MTDLTTEFRQGAAAAAAGADRSSCPHYATSNAADAWHAGHVFQACSVFGLVAADVAQVSKGRGARLNLWPFAAGDKMVATVAWNDAGGDPLPPVTFDQARDWSPAMKAAHVDQERDRQLLELRAAAPMQARGRAVSDAGHLPLFVAANEPELFA